MMVRRRKRSPIQASHYNPLDDPAYLAIKKRLVFVAELYRFSDRETRGLLQLPAVNALYAHELDGIHVVDLLIGPGNPCDKVSTLTFQPGGPDIVLDGHRTGLNLWRPRDFQAKPGDVQPFLDHVAYLLGDEPAAITFVLNWLAYLLQHPAVKLPSGLILLGKPGTGKSLFANMAAELVGRSNVQFLAVSGLYSDHNDWISRAHLVIVNELGRRADRKAVGPLKSYVTEEIVSVNPKGVSIFSCPNHAHFILLGNMEDEVPIEPDDRRWFVWRSGVAAKPDDYYTSLRGWFYDHGKHAVLSWLLRRDLLSFNPYARPPATASAAAVINEGLPPAESYLTEALESNTFPVQCPLVVAKDIVDAMRTVGHTITLRQVQQTLERAGALPLGQKRIGGSKPRVIAVRDVEYWRAHGSDAKVASIYHHPLDPPPVQDALAPQPLRRTSVGASASPPPSATASPASRS